jgi:hypothetical protein
MKRNLLFVALITVAISFQAVGQKTVTAPKYDYMIVNGLLTESAWQVDQAVDQIISGVPVVDTNTVLCGVVYSDEYLYVGLDVLDAVPTPYEMGEVFIDGNNNGGAYDEYDLHIRFVGISIEVIHPDTITGYVLGFAIKPGAVGYTAELAIPLAAINITPTEGGEIGFDVFMGDRDLASPGVDYMVSWNGDMTNYESTDGFGTLTFGVSSGVNDKTDASAGLKIYPNPATGMVYVESADHTLTCEISDVTGRMIYSGNMDSAKGKLAVDLKNANPGVYFVTVMDENSTKNVQKLLIR